MLRLLSSTVVLPSFSGDELPLLGGVVLLSSDGDVMLSCTDLAECASVGSSIWAA